MQDILTTLGQLNRPRLLVRTAKAAAQNYERKPHLGRLLGSRDLPKSSEAILALLDIERSHEDRRIDNQIGYSMVDHVDVMIAIIGEARNLQAPQIS